MNVLEVIARELRAARESALELVRVRVTSDAIPGSPVAVPFTPERARALRTYVVELEHIGALAGADPELERARELVIHPDDWRALELERGLGTPYAVTVNINTGEESVLGLRVRRPTRV